MPSANESPTMEPSPDELAGIVDGFGGLTRTELRAAIEDLTARSGDVLDREAIENGIEAALADYYLVELDPTTALEDAIDGGSEPVLIPGPAALPELPDGGEDLPYLVEIEPRTVDRGAAAESIASRLRSDAAAATAADDVDRARTLLDVCYEVEAWGPVALDETKADLADLSEG